MHVETLAATRLTTDARLAVAAVPPTLRITGLRKRLGRRTVVDGVDLQVRAGEVVGLVGPNGAGKTTLMHLVAGLLRPDAGEIRIAGDLDPSDAATRSRIGIAPQAIALYGELSAEENLRFFASLYGLRGASAQAAVARGLAFAELASRRQDRVATFSGGMQRRLNLACALLQDPLLVLLDEPTAGVDPQSRGHLLDGVRALRAEGRGVLYTTHHLEEAGQVCDRVVVVDHGKVVAEGSVDDVLGAASTRDAAFLALTGRGQRDA